MIPTTDRAAEEARHLQRQNQVLRSEIIRSLESVIRDLGEMLDQAKNGQTVYSNALRGSTIASLPERIEVLRAQERIALSLESSK